MSDIFISYSRNDLEQAQLLAQLLSSAGLSVWIDQSGIDVSTSWSKEIVQAIDGCKAFVVLLSPHSVRSKNVVREVALAFEKDKKILPLDLEPVVLSEDLQYHLAGIQRAPMTNIDSIIRTLGKLGLEATQAPTITIVKDTDTRKSLMILPFQDLSPTGDNGWFADGIVSELIQVLSNVKALKVTDAQSTKDFKRYQGTLPNYAKEMQVRYFVEGDVRKFGDQIKVNTRLLDIETGDHLWQDSMKGTMEDIFDIQEQVAEKVVNGLKIHLAPQERKRITQRGTENAEAYELSLKAGEYFVRNTREGFELAAQLSSEAILLDPAFASAYVTKANALASLYHIYTRDPRLLEEGLALVRQAFSLRSDQWSAFIPMSLLLMDQGNFDEAERVAKEYVRLAPDEFTSHAILAGFYGTRGQYEKAIASFETALRLNPDELVTFQNLVITCNAAKDFAKQKEYALLAIPKYERHLKLFPNDENKRVGHAMHLYFAGRLEEAKMAARQLDDLTDGSTLFNSACLQCALGEFDAGMAALTKAVAAGFRNLEDLNAFLEANEEGIGTLKGTPEWDRMKLLVSTVVTEARLHE